MDFSYHNETTLHPLVLGLIALASAWLLLSPRRVALYPVFALACFVSPAQRIVIGGLDFTLTKILVLVALARILVRGEMRGMRWTRVDSAVTAWIGFSTAAFITLHGTSDAIVNRAGWALEIYGLYLVLRMSIREFADVDRLTRLLMWLALPVAAAFAVELTTGHNPFAIFGGVEEITRIRDGKLRCQGAFAHPIIAGVFWASTLPLFWVAMRRGSRLLAPLALCAAGFIVFATASSTPLAAVLVVGLGFALFPFRGSLKHLRWAGLFGGVFLHFYREKPIWHLMSRIDLSGGSTGYHRFKLMDGAIHNFDEWALLGTLDTEWLGMNDITNQFVLEGFNGGIAALLALVFAPAFAFMLVGRTLRTVAMPRSRQLAVWGFGVVLAVHAASFLAVSYFGQANLVFVFALALIAGLPRMANGHEPVVRTPTRRRVEPWAVAAPAR